MKKVLGEFIWTTGNMGPGAVPKDCNQNPEFVKF